MKYGYARVSTANSRPALQLAALKRAGCKGIFKDAGLSRATCARLAFVGDTQAAPHPTPVVVASALDENAVSGEREPSKGSGVQRPVDGGAARFAPVGIFRR